MEWQHNTSDIFISNGYNGIITFEVRIVNVTVQCHIYEDPAYLQVKIF
jgi:hypothetical protein